MTYFALRTHLMVFWPIRLLIAPIAVALAALVVAATLGMESALVLRQPLLITFSLALALNVAWCWLAPLLISPRQVAATTTAAASGNQ